MRPTLLRAFAVSCLLAGSASSAWALAVQGYDASVNERFASGFSSGPIVVNTDPDFTLAGYDLSGVGWQTAASTFAVTLISPRHALTAAHVAPAVNSSVSFLGQDGIVRSYTVSAVTNLSFNGRASDAVLVQLGTAVDTTQIATYFGLGLASTAAYQNLPVTLYGANGRVGLNTVEDVGAFDLLPFSTGPGVPSGDGNADSVIGYTDFDPVTGEAQGQGGDSGSPTFARMSNGDLALVGIHSAIGTVSGTQITIDSMPLLASQTQINSLLAADSYGPWNYYTGGVVAPAAIPEPAALASLLGGAALACAVRLRRRGRPDCTRG